MATIEDLDGQSISELSVDEALELLRQIRLSRRTYKGASKKPASKTPAKQKASAPMTPEQAKKLLELIGG